MNRTENRSKPFQLALAATFFIFISSLQGFCQHSQIGTVNWTINPVNHKVFVKSQRAEVKDGAAVYYYTLMGNIKVYFTSNGLLYEYDKTTKESNPATEDDADDPAQKSNVNLQTYYAKMQWVAANANVVPLGDEMQNDYYTSLKDANVKSYSYKKIIYKNLYPDVDVVYTFPKNKQGIEYSLLVHSGADMSKIKMLYDGVSSVTLDKNGNVELSVAQEGVTNIIDHAPQSFYTDSKKHISSSFVVKGDTVSFNLAGYDRTKAITIDPWTINPFFTTQDKAFDIAVDNAGNIYAYGGGGGGSAWTLKKFTSAGSPLWTFTTTYTSWFGALAVDGAGNAYITEGCCGGGIQKINTGGTSVWSVNNGVYEYWDLAFDPTFTNLYLGCGYSAGAIPAESVSFLNTTNGNITGSVALNSAGSEPRAMVVASNSNLYFLTPTVVSSGGNYVLGITPAFANIFSVANGYALLYNGPLFANGSNTTSGQNGIAASRTTFIATTDGATLIKRNIATGALIASIAIPGGSTENNSGVAIDSCGNIFVGSQTAVYEYDSLLNPLTSVATGGAVYDILYIGGGQILASGNGFISSLSFPACGVVLPVQLINFSCSQTHNGVMLNWATASETNNKYFTIERSADGISFMPIKQVSASGNSTKMQSYSYIDTNAKNGENYYRLNQTDFDGHTQTFNTTVCNISRLIAGNISPNPATGSFTITLGPSAQNQTVTICDVLGQNVYSHVFPSNNSFSNHIINVPQLKGVYIVIIVGEEQNIVRKIILN